MNDEGAQNEEQGGRPAPRRGDGRPLPRRPSTTLVLGGGGVKGLAHVGVIRALDRLGLEVDAVVGTSIGALVGAGFAAGMTPAQLETMAADLCGQGFFRLAVLRSLVRGHGESADKGERFAAFLREHLPVHAFASLGLPFFCSAVSVTTGGLRTFGLPRAAPVSVPDAVHASACLPGVLEPVEIDGEHFLDGGIAEPLPLRVAVTQRPELIIAVDLSAQSPHDDRTFRSGLPFLLHRTYEIVGAAINEHVLHRFADHAEIVMVQPPVADVAIAGEVDVADVIHRGEVEACRTLAAHPLTRWLCAPDLLKELDREFRPQRDHVVLDVDMDACIHCGICAVTCTTGGYARVPTGDVVRKLHHYECTRDGACARACPTRAIRLENL